MTAGLRRAAIVGVAGLAAAGGAVLGQVRADAASGAASVNVRRIATLNYQVFTGDFNGDGIVDLVSHQASPDGVPLIALGRGDGTFGAATAIGTSAGHVVGIGDLDKDGRLDLIVEQPPNATTVPYDEIVALRGNGNGTFTIANSDVSTPSSAAFVLVVDYDGDGKNDLILGEDNDGDASLHFLQGHGDFTFTFGGFVAANGFLTSGIIADVNGDGRPDIVTTGHDARVVSVYLHGAAGGFTASDIPFADQANDVAAVDVDHDGKIDLLVATSQDGADDLFYTSGSVQVLRGNGNGTFQTPRVYASGRGAWKLAVGDFNRDGVPDVATANRSGKLAEDYCGHVWDSVSILPGRTDGSFGAPSTFSLGDQTLSQGDRFYNSVMSLYAADLNGDGFPDLAASWGAILLNHAPDTNWAPTVDAGPDRDASKSHAIALFASASDVDQDQLTYRWTDSGGTPMENSPAPCIVAPATLGVHTFTVTVDDGQGHTASDSVVVDFGSDSGGGGGGGSTSLSFIAPAVGATIVAGRPYEIRFHVDDSAQALYEWSIDYSIDDGATWSHIWECHNAGRSSGPGVPASRDESCTWQNPGPPSAHARMVVYAQDDADAAIGTPGNTSFAIQGVNGAVPDPWRHQDVGAVAVGGSATASDASTFSVTASGADIWGTADEFHFLYQDGNVVSPVDSGAWEITARVTSVTNTDPWTKAGLMIREGLGASARHASVFVSPGKGIAFQRRTSTGGASVTTSGPALTAPVWLKLGVQNGTVTAYYRKALTDPWTVIGRQAFTEFSSVSAGIAVTSHHDGQPATANVDNVDLHQDPAFVSKDVGTTGGSTTSDGVITTMTAKGTDVWGTSDQFRYATGSFGTTTGSITARVRSVQNVNAWTKAGVMFRELSPTGTIDANAKYVFVMVSPGHGVTMQYRSATGGAAASVATAPIAGTAPGWVRLSRNGDTFTGEWSSNGATWTTVGTATVSFAAANGSYSLLALTSHSSSTATASFDDVVVRQ